MTQQISSNKLNLFLYVSKFNLKEKEKKNKMRNILKHNKENKNKCLEFRKEKM